MQGSLLVLKPLTDPRNMKMITPNTNMNIPRYLYSVNRNEVAPAKNHVESKLQKKRLQIFYFFNGFKLKDCNLKNLDKSTRWRYKTRIRNSVFSISSDVGRVSVFWV